MLLFLCLYESWLAEAIVLDYACGESHVRRHLCCIVGVERVALKEQPASFPQASHGVAGDGTIEEQRVGVGDEEWGSCRRTLACMSAASRLQI